MTPSRVNKTKNKTKKKPKRKNIFRTPNPETILFLCDMVYKLEYMVHHFDDRIGIIVDGSTRAGQAVEECKVEIETLKQETIYVLRQRIEVLEEQVKELRSRERLR